ncbi:MAG: endonuclease/exonuclease/phosphatase family protein [Actinomycetota bacterium]
MTHAPRRSASATELRLLTWNVQHSGPERAQRQAAWLAGLEEADVLVLTEVQDSPGGRALVRALRSHGYTVVVPPRTASDYMVIVAARTEKLEMAECRLDFRPHRCVVVRILLGTSAIGVVGLYVPSRGRQDRRNIDKAAFQNAVSTYLPRLVTDFPEELVVVAGDLNVLEPDHLPHYPLFGDWEYRFYADFIQLGGLVDAFRELHPEAVEHSWIGRAGDGYRFDHIFVSSRHREQLRVCRYLHEARLNGLSDHAAMVAVLTFEEMDKFQFST